MPMVLGEREAANLGGIDLVKTGKFYTTKKKFERNYYVLSDNLLQTEQTIITTSGIPDYLSELSGAWCMKKKGKEIQRVGRHPVTGVPCVLWEVSASFDSDVDIEEATMTPQARTPKLRWYGENEEEVLETDAVSGDPIVTAAGEQIIITGPTVISILEVRRYEVPPFDPTIQLAYANHTNLTEFYGAPTGTALMQAPEAGEEQVIEQERVIEVIYRIKFKMRRAPGGSFLENTWNAKPLHQGTKFFPEVGSPAQVYTDKLGNQTTVNLAANGTRLADGDPAVYLDFARHAKAEFNTLSLGPF